MWLHAWIHWIESKEKTKGFKRKERKKKWSSQQKVIIFYDWEENVWLWVERDALYSTMKHIHLHIRTFIWEWKQQHFYEFFDSSHIQLVGEWEIIQCKHTTLYIYVYAYWGYNKRKKALQLRRKRWENFSLFMTFNLFFYSYRIIVMCLL